MILLLGASGYIGRAFANELRRRGQCFVPLTCESFDYTRFEFLFNYVRKMEPEFLINATDLSAEIREEIGHRSREQALYLNTILPQTIARVCLMTNTPWGHVSSTAIFSGAKVLENGILRVEKNLNTPKMRALYAAHPEVFYGFNELDEPNLSFRNAPCSFYSGTKALAEEAIRDFGRSFIWRIGDTFNEQDDPCNLLSRLQNGCKVRDILGSFAQVDDAVRACLDLWRFGAAFGTYNVTNSGVLSTRQMVEMIRRILHPGHNLVFLRDDEDVYQREPGAPDSHCIVDVSKLSANRIQMRAVREAVEYSLKRWQTASSTCAQPAASPNPLFYPRLLPDEA